MRELFESAGDRPRLKDLLREADRRATQALKVLRHPRWKNLEPEHSGSRDRAIELAKLVIALAKRARRSNAFQASIFAEKLELVLDLLHVEMCDLFRS